MLRCALGIIVNISYSNQIEKDMLFNESNPKSSTISTNLNLKSKTAPISKYNNA